MDTTSLIKKISQKYPIRNKFNSNFITVCINNTPNNSDELFCVINNIIKEYKFNSTIINELISHLDENNINFYSCNPDANVLMAAEIMLNFKLNVDYERI